MKKFIMDKAFYLVCAFVAFVFTLSLRVAALETEYSTMAKDIHIIKCYLNDKFEGCKK